MTELGTPHPYEGLDIATVLHWQASVRPDCTFLDWCPFEAEARSWTYAEFARDVDVVAAGLAARGLQREDRLLLALQNRPEFLLTWFACARLGILVVCANPATSEAERAYLIGHSEPAAAIVEPNLASSLDGRSLRWIVCPEVDPVRGDTWDVDGIGEPFRALNDASTQMQLPSRQPEPGLPLSVQYTSGSTASPKGVVWTHANALWAGQVGAAHQGLTPADAHLTYLPLFHANALGYSVLPSLWAGARIVLQPRFSSSRFWDVATRLRCTWTSMVPFCRRALANTPAPEQHSFRLWGYAVCDLPDDERYGIRTLGWWGMTETVSHGIVGSLNAPNRPRSMGRPAPEYQIEIRAPGGDPADIDEPGRLYVKGVRGISLFAGYLDDPDATDAAFDDGWFDTGDIVTRRADGCIDFTDRAKEMLKVGGENVAPLEVELAISTLPGVRDVAVVGRPHPMLDEVPVAFVVASDPGDLTLADRVLVHCETHLSSFKVPTEVRLIDALPKTTLDKTAKSSLRRLFTEVKPTDEEQQA